MKYYKVNVLIVPIRLEYKMLVLGSVQTDLGLNRPVRSSSLKDIGYKYLLMRKKEGDRLLVKVILKNCV